MPTINTTGAASAKGFGFGVSAGAAGGGPAAIVYPSTVVGIPNPATTSYDSAISSPSTATHGWVAFTTGYDSYFINEWDALSLSPSVGANGAAPGNLSSNLGRSVPSTWSALLGNSNRDGSTSRNPERPGFGLFVIGRCTPPSVTSISVAAYGGGGFGPNYSNYAGATFTVSNGEAFRVVPSNYGAGLTSGGADGIGGSPPDGDRNGRYGGAGSGFWYVGICRVNTAKNRFLVAGGSANRHCGTNAQSSGFAGDPLYGPQYGNGSNHSEWGGGPGAGGQNDGGNSGGGGDYNTGTGSVTFKCYTSTGHNGYGGGTGGNGTRWCSYSCGCRFAGAGGGFAYNRIGLGGGGGKFGGGGGWNGGAGGWGDNSSAGTSKIVGATSTITTGAGFNSGLSCYSLSSMGFPYTGSFNLAHPRNAAGFVVIWW